MVSQRSTASTSTLFLYSLAKLSIIVFLIKSPYSSSTCTCNRNEVLSFQKPRPLGLLLQTGISKIDCKIIREWSVLSPSKISAFVISGVKLALIRKKSRRQNISGFFLNLLASVLKTHHTSIRSSKFSMFWTSLS